MYDHRNMRVIVPATGNCLLCLFSGYSEAKPISVLLLILKLRSSNRDYWPYNTSSVAKCLMYYHCNKLVLKHSLLCLSYLQIKNMTLISEIKELFLTPAFPPSVFFIKTMNQHMYPSFFL